MRRRCELQSQWRRTAPRTGLPARRGQALLEFALIFLVIYLLVVAIVEFGRLFSGAQTLQSAVDQAARELSRVPLPPTATFATALASPQVINGVYDPNYLAINISGMQPGQSLFDFFAAQGISLPSVNQALLPMMINDTVGGVPLLRYPGALLTSTTPSGTKPGYSGYTVAVPLVVSAREKVPRPSSGTACSKRSPIRRETAPSASHPRPRPDSPEGSSPCVSITRFRRGRWPAINRRP